MSQSNIAIFIPSLGGGGAEKAMVNLMAESAKRGTFIDLITIDPEEKYINFLPQEIHWKVLQPQFFMHSPLLQSRFLKNLKYITVLPMLVKYIKKRNIHILLTTLHIPNIIGLIIKKYFVKDIISIVRMANTFSVQSSKSKNWQIRLATNIQRPLLPIVDAIIANSKGSAENIKLHLPTVSNLVHVIYNPVTSPNITIQAEKPINHPWIGPPNFKIILSVNRLHPQKDLSTLLRAFAEVMKLEPSRLIILGQGPEENKLKKIADKLGIRNTIDFVGFQQNPFSWMDKADVFVLSSLFEGCPNTLIEAMACGTPVVSTDCQSGPREILKDGRLGRLVPVGNYKELASAILETFNNPVSSKILKERAQDFSVKLSVDRYLSLFKNMDKKRHHH